MKIYISKKYRIIVVVTLFSLFSCNGFLETVPRSQYQSDSFYQTKDAAAMAVNSIYNPMLNFFNYEWEQRTMLLEANSGLFVADFEAVYTQFWIGISDANIALEKIPDIDFKGDETTKNDLIAQARFLRAFYYHMLSMMLGPVPLITETLSYNELTSVSRADNVDVIRNFIIGELLAAEPYLLTRSKSTNGRVTTGCADYLLATVYMFQKNWSEAEKWLKKIIDSKEYSLLSDFGNICSYDTHLAVCNAWEYTSESLFEVGHIEGVSGYSDGYTDRYTPANCSGNDYRTNLSPMSSNFYEKVLLIGQGTISKTVSQDSIWINKLTGKYVTTKKGQTALMPNYIEDPRRPYTCVKWGDMVPCAVNPNYYVDVTSTFYKESTTLLKRKYWPTSAATYGGLRGMNFIIWRYANVLLDYAEVQYRLGNISKEYEYMNMVRGRAWKDYPESKWKRKPNEVFEPNANWNKIVYPVLAQSGYGKEFIDLIHEYFLEFAHEGGITMQLMMRWQNRVDIAKAFGYAESSIYEDRTWFEYPTDELAKNPNLTQNPGF